MTKTILQPPNWPRPKGYANGIVAEGKSVWIAGQIGWDEKSRLTTGLVAQIEQALRNVLVILAVAGGGPEHVVRMTWYLVDIEDYAAKLNEIGAAYQRVMGRNFPVMTAIEVRRLVEHGALVEIEVTAVLP
jgi:enamine deaminase RidA (YjgF/YER057c/UK114 family)